MKSKIKSLKSLKKILRALRQKGARIVFTNGCFDLIHYGHVSYLAKAKSRGDYLVVGLNSDKSVKKIKDAGRPLIPQADRAKMLAAFEPVDFIVLFDDDTPCKLIEGLKPDVLVKGADYKAKEIAGSDIVKKSGGKVVRMPLAKGRSTTSLIQKIINLYGKKDL